MTAKNGTADFIDALSLLDGNDFEDAVVGHLSRGLPDFQPVPRKGGDGGLDGLCQGNTVAYCCYGPEDPRLAKALDKALRRKIVDKFRSDLRRLFELSPKGGKGLVHAPNAVLAGVMGTNRKIECIRLVINRFDDNALIGELNDVFTECHGASRHNFVSASCSLTIMGPKELSNHVPASEETLFRLRQPALAAVLAATDQTKAELAAGALGMFDVKFDDLRGRHPRPAAVEEAREGMREHWASALAFDQRLAEVAPSLHQDLDLARRGAAAAAQRRQLAAGELDARTEMEAALEAFVTWLQSNVGAGIDHSRRDAIAEGEVARLVGDCAIDWREGT